MLRLKNMVILQRRWRSRRSPTQQNKKQNTLRALASFDDFYGSVYGLRWRNMRAALLTEHKYVALVNNFGDVERTCSGLELNGAINLKSLVNLAKERVSQYDEEPIKQMNSKLHENLDILLRKKVESEKQALYPESTSDQTVSAQLQYSDEEQKKNESSINNEESTNISGPSLEEAIEKCERIDYSRLIDPQVSTGGLHEYMPASKIKGMEDWIPESDHYRYYQTQADFPLNFEIEKELCYPENLYLYTYEMGNCLEFETPRKCLTGVLSHYLMDGASVLPPLFLDIKHGERVLDACAAPGGKALLMLQTLYPDILVCNDIQESRINRIRKIMQEYIFDYKENWENKRVTISQHNAQTLADYESYDKILVDVPCTTDRHSLMENDNNIFKPTRVKERLRIPELQAGILANCLRLLKPGGTLVYSTCTLSPVQNDGVVHMALQRAFNEHGITATIKDLRLVIKLFEDIFKFEYPRDLKYGQMVVPFLPSNYGPMYFSKLKRDT